MGSKKVIYIAGPISGVPNYWEAFEKAEDELEAAGYIALSPTRLNFALGNDKAMRICITMINEADAVYFLPGYERSEGAQLEMAYCTYTRKPYGRSIEELKEVLA